MDNDLLKQSEKEAEFFDTLYADADKSQSRNDYIVPNEIIRQISHPSSPPLHYMEYASTIIGDVKGKRMMDYGAGDGWTTIGFAKAGAEVMAIDISEKGVALITKKAESNGVGDLIKAEVQNCYKTKFSTDEFKIIFGNGILHHLDLEASGREISRILKADGVAVFPEPIRETRIMDFVKTVVMFVLNKKPLEETEEEEPLTKERILVLKNYFKTVRLKYFNVFSSASLVFKSQKLASALLWLDDLFIRNVPGFEKLGRAVVIELRGPLIND
ncbi:MAG: class I SAM-dependent methyltransferase [Candidatus Zixiibacteriota bacterium]